VLKAAGGFFVVMSVWLGIQAFARRKSGCARDRDMLDYMLHGCGNCLHATATNRKKRKNCGRGARRRTKPVQPRSAA
jgi:hypothetical protein